MEDPAKIFKGSELDFGLGVCCSRPQELAFVFIRATVIKKVSFTEGKCQLKTFEWHCENPNERIFGLVLGKHVSAIVLQRGVLFLQDRMCQFVDFPKYYFSLGIVILMLKVFRLHLVGLGIVSRF